MKKYGSLIAAAVVAILAALVLMTKDEPMKKVEAPYSVPAVEQLSRVEITQPGEDGGLVVLEKDGESWKLTKPVDAPLAARHAEKLDEAFKTKINTDDITLSADKSDEFGLAEGSGTRVALFAGEATAPTAEFTVGKTFTVESTRAKRTYIKNADGKIYRAQTDIGDVVTKPVSDLRDKSIQKLDRSSIMQVAVDYEDGREVRLARKSKADDWAMVQPEPGLELERSQVSTLLNSVSNLNASGFVDGKKPEEVGLQPPYASIRAKDGMDKMYTLRISEPEDGKAFVMTSDSTHIFEVAETTANALTPTALSLRKRIVKEIMYDNVNRVDFGGEERISVQKDGEDWTFVRGGEGKVKESALRSRLTSLTQVRAFRFDDEVTLKDAGLDKPTERVVLHTDDTKHTLLIGNEADKKGNLWAKWESNDLVMVIPQWVKTRGTPTAADLKEDES